MGGSGCATSGSGGATVLLRELRGDGGTAGGDGHGRGVLQPNIFRQVDYHPLFAGCDRLRRVAAYQEGGQRHMRRNGDAKTNPLIPAGRGGGRG